MQSKPSVQDERGASHFTPKTSEARRASWRRFYARNRERMKAASNARRRRYKRECPDRLETHRLKCRYGLTHEQAEVALTNAQFGLCDSCGTLSAGLHIDHDHNSGKARGMLCGGCNLALGHMKDSPERLRAGAAYLERT